MTNPDMDTDPDSYCDTGKTFIGGGMHCPSASSSVLIFRVIVNTAKATWI